jgi:uncharacterized membrane protein
MSIQEQSKQAKKISEKVVERVIDTIVPIIYFSWGIVTGLVIAIVLWATWN